MGRNPRILVSSDSKSQQPGRALVGFMAIWGAPLQWSDAWLPLLGALQATLMALIALKLGARLFPDGPERGLVGICSGIGNHGVTMAGFAVYLLFGAAGLGINTIYAIYTFSEEFLKIPPLWFWASWEHDRLSSVEIPVDTRIVFDEP